jgi:hypothetical protein
MNDSPELAAMIEYLRQIARMPNAESKLHLVRSAIIVAHPELHARFKAEQSEKACNADKPETRSNKPKPKKRPRVTWPKELAC